MLAGSHLASPPQEFQVVTRRIPVAVLGATGVVGQRFVARLADHPWFEIVQLAASERSVGREYAQSCSWRVAGARPYGGFAEHTIVACDPAHAAAPVVFSALDASVAREVEPAFARAGSIVFSNASAFRMEEDVPLVVPEVNPDHLDLVALQRERRGWSGAIVCNPNCTSAILVSALAPLQRRFGVEALMLSSMQAVSGAGYPGVASLDALGNVIPFIRGEEEKVEAETRRMLGELKYGGVHDADCVVSAACHRAPVIDGHSMSVSLRLRGNPALELVAQTLAEWRSEPQLKSLPTAPKRALVLHELEDRPQPRLDVDSEGGMAVQVGRLRPCPILGLKLFVVGHNLERGAAGGSVLNAELMHARGMLSS